MPALTPTITAGEYVSTLFRVIPTLAARPELKCQRYRVGLLYLWAASPGQAVQVFSDLVRRRPNDQTAHRLLGIAQLRQGNPQAAVKHLEIALGLLKREATVQVGLYGTLYIQCEEALLRLVLMPLYISMGQVRRAYFLMREGQTL
ncbi:MAG: tetratricopeptide repeat protein [Candidatus Methylomirabilia bacterium]